MKGYLLPAFLCSATVLCGLSYAKLRASSSRNSMAFFAEQVWTFLVTSLVGLALIVMLWFEGQWSLRFPVMSFAAYVITAALWFATGTWAWNRSHRSKVLSSATHRERIASGALLGLGALLLVWLGVWLGWMSLTVRSPLETGLLNGNLSYEVKAGAHGISFLQGPIFSYSIYRTPEWFAVIRKEVAGGTLAGDGPGLCVIEGDANGQYRAKSVRFSMGQDDQSVLMTCTINWGIGPESNTVEVSIP